MISLGPERLFLFGGVDRDGHVQSCGYLIDIGARKWQTISFTNPQGLPMLPRYSAVAVCMPGDTDQILICGGISVFTDGTTIPSGTDGSAVIRLDLKIRRWQSLVNNIKSFWPAGHDALLLPPSREDSKQYRLVISGGGGVCFSMGSYFNASFTVIPLSVDETEISWKMRATCRWIRNSRTVPRILFADICSSGSQSSLIVFHS
jgi:hypothetical protein